MSTPGSAAPVAVSRTRRRRLRAGALRATALLIGAVVSVVPLAAVAAEPAASGDWPQQAPPGDVFALPDADAYQLRFVRTPPPTTVAIRQLERRGVLERVSVAEVLASADHTAYEQSKPQCDQAKEAIAALDAEEVGAYCWDAESQGDGVDSYWVPQGVTEAPAEHATSDGRPLVVGWHAPKDVAAMLSFVNPPAAAGADLAYANVMLLDAEGQPGSLEVVPLHSHLGGIGWWGERLYTAQTWTGMRVYDTTSIYRVSTGKDLLGLDPSDGKFYANGFSYVMFPVGSYERVLNGPEDALVCDRTPTSIKQNYCFSALSVDPQTQSIITAEYWSPADAETNIENSMPGRVLRWPLTASGDLERHDAVVTASAAYGTYTPSIQGVASDGDTFYLSTSRANHQPGVLWIDRPDSAPESTPWGIGPEALMIQHDLGRIWSLTEYRHLRMLYWISQPR